MFFYWYPNNITFLEVLGGTIGLKLIILYIFFKLNCLFYKIQYKYDEFLLYMTYHKDYFIKNS